MEKDFDEWNSKKKQISKETPRFYTVREIWWCRFGINIGSEQNGKGIWYTRPCIIVKSFGPNACLVVPLTTSQRKHLFRIPIGIINGIEARANISQLRVVDTRRFEEKIGFIEKDYFMAIQKALRNMF